MRRSPSFVPVPAIAGIVLLLGGVLSACGDERGEAPVADSTFVGVLVDLHLLDARQELGYDVSPGARDSVLAVHGVDAAGFAEAVRYHARDPQRYAALYARAVDRLLAAQPEAAFDDEEIDGFDAGPDRLSASPGGGSGAR